MCGIFLLSSKKPLSDIEISKLKLITTKLRHRGPDAEGFFLSEDRQVFISHYRLAIIDLDERSNQPMIKENLVITFNGEIYNFKKIKQELTKRGSKFFTESDTEVILEAYKHFGKDCLDLFTGMFAFCIYNKNSKEIFCARDRIGEKPLIYYIDDQKLIIASEIPVILRTLREIYNSQPDIDNDILSLYYLGTYRHIPEPYSIWKGIKKLEPAKYLLIKDNKIQENNFYYQPKISKEYLNYPESKICKMVKQSLIEAVELTTVSDVPLAVLLSGGVDSSIISFILKKILNKDIIAFTYGRDENDEEIQRARLVANKLKIPLKIFYFKEGDVLKSLRDIISIYGEPLCLFQFAYSDILYKNIRNEGIKVVITGNGGDEIFMVIPRILKLYYFRI
ncbi:asparagine synthase [Caldimicrobium thiodismutans]|uniref:asparagine synthase (glutamine-hydrolyzing) n=1 Tax=Caldimicrobium thiodismutans TaxID=1653476 RepID=A0A0U5ANV8_9BACT|nr:asparagine synthase (glutamine-hydrolyzing) [Caldimicrobium thiodismutans]BAU23570.1 asparagine synthase [Caldimicrobium thiodismutans]